MVGIIRYWEVEFKLDFWVLESVHGVGERSEYYFLVLDAQYFPSKLIGFWNWLTTMACSIS